MKKRFFSLCLMGILFICIFPSITLRATGTSNSNYISAVEQAISENQANGWDSGYGALYDIDGNGIEELIMVYSASVQLDDGYDFPAKACSLYTTSNGNAVQLLDKKILFTEIGGPTGHVSVVQYNGDVHFAITAENGEAGVNRYGTWELFTISGKSIESAITVNYDYHRNANNKSSATINGKTCGYQEYEKWKTGLSEILHIDPYENDNVMTLEELLEYLHHNPNQDYDANSNSSSTTDVFCLDKDCWSFANTSLSFKADPENPFCRYYIPKERYDEVLGPAYLETNKFTTSWGGNCAGMSTTAILFFLDYLDWNTINAAYPVVFPSANSFYQKINYHYTSHSGYASIGNNTEVTRLIEAYQLYINAINRVKYEVPLYGTYHTTDAIKDGIFSYYTFEHLPDGTYIDYMLEEFRKAYEENTPLYISLTGNGSGHAIVSRTDKEPQDMGNGWWRVYVYDPNKPFVNEYIAEQIWEKYPDAGLRFACNDLDEDVYIELNPTRNLWRYYGSISSNIFGRYWGCNQKDKVLYLKCEGTEDETKKIVTVKRPEYFYTINLNDINISDYSKPFTTEWIPSDADDSCIIAVDELSDCLIYSSTGELTAVVENGEAIVLNRDGYYTGNIGDSDDISMNGGKLYLPSDTYTVQYTSGQISFLGNMNVVNISGEGAMNLTIDIVNNRTKILAAENGKVYIKSANIISANECSYVETEGQLLAGEHLSLFYTDNSKVRASTDSKDGEFQLYQKGADQGEASATKIIRASNPWWMWFVAVGIIAVLLTVFLGLKRKIR